MVSNTSRTRSKRKAKAQKLTERKFKEYSKKSQKKSEALRDLKRIVGQPK